MSENKFDAIADEASGKVKEVAGKVTGDKELETEGVVENLGGKAKEAFENAKEGLSDAVENAKEGVQGAVEGAKEALGIDDAK